MDGETPLKAVAAGWKVGKAHAEGRGFPAAGNWLLSGCSASQGCPRRHVATAGGVQSQHARWENGIAKNVCITHPFTLLPWSSSASWRGGLPLGTVGTATALKSQLKVTVSPPAWFPWGVKWYATSTDYFHLLGLQAFMFYLQACVLRGNKVAGEVLHEWRHCTELWPVPRQLRVHTHKDWGFVRKVFPIRKCDFKWKRYLWGSKRDWSLWQMFFNIPGRWNEAKRKLASTWALEQNKVVLFQNIQSRWKKLFSSILLLFF